jgi:hypothetical protein
MREYGGEMELVTITLIFVLSSVLGVAGARAALRMVFFLMEPMTVRARSGAPVVVLRDPTR